MWQTGMLAVCGAMLLACSAQASITVTGTGKVKYTPDQAHLNLGVSREAKSAAEAWKLNAEAVRKIFDALEALGIDGKDLKTVSVGVGPKYVHEQGKEPRLVGYVA